jgi:hypothetical protein
VYSSNTSTRGGPFKTTLPPTLPSTQLPSRKMSTFTKQEPCKSSTTSSPGSPYSAIESSLTRFEPSGAISTPSFYSIPPVSRTFSFSFLVGVHLVLLEVSVSTFHRPRSLKIVALARIIVRWFTWLTRLRFLCALRPELLQFRTRSWPIYLHTKRTHGQLWRLLGRGVCTCLGSRGCCCGVPVWRFS